LLLKAATQADQSQSSHRRSASAPVSDSRSICQWDQTGVSGCEIWNWSTHTWARSFGG